MRIAICDDEAVFRRELRGILAKYKRRHRMQIDVNEFSNGEDFLNSDAVFDMVFLDYQMLGIDGMETARILRERNSMCSIVFVTNYPGFVIDAFEVAPFRFFPKPVTSDMVGKMLDAYVRARKILAPIIINSSENGQVVIPAENIVYLSGDGKYCNLHMKNQETPIHSSKTLSGVLELLPKYCFYRTHKSYAINMFHVYRIEEKFIVLDNGIEVKISRKHHADFNKVYRNFIRHFYPSH